MAAADPWLKEFDEAEQVVNDAFGLLHERESNLREGRDVARLTATIRRKASTLSSKLESLSALLAESSVTARENTRRSDMLGNLRRRGEELVSHLSKNKTSLNGGDGASGSQGGRAQETEQTAELDNRGILQLQRNLMHDQDEELEELSRVVTSTRHIGLAVGEELDLHARLLDDLDDDVDRTGSRLKRAQRLARMVYEKASDCKLIMCGSLLVVVLVLLLVLILKHF